MSEPTSAVKQPCAKAPFHRLSIFLSMDFSTVVLFRHNFHTRRRTCIWGDNPSVARMQAQARTYLDKIPGLDLTDVDWMNSDVLLDAVNRPRNRRPTYGELAGEYI
ncbi:hypothetical protein [Actinokineospora sp. HUAS TT18]|uniref:hypothetical protein n=1 Tax=Actinokineospora sp. HUAS TT18 TaxID=3447451 RepID=UPI003F527616